MASIFFDLDGTLTDPKVGITRCIQHALARMDEPVPDAEALTWCIGPPLQETFATLIDDRRVPEAIRYYRERFADVGLFENDPYPEIHDTLAVLREEHAALYVASSKPLVFVQQILERYELADFFRGVYGSELDGTRTDKSDLLKYALQETNTAPHAGTMVGDRKHDAIGARNNGLDFVGVLYGYGDRDEFQSVGAEVMVDEHQHLLTLFETRS